MDANTAILVLGMHRSGTSLVAGLLERLGVDLGSNLLPPQADNPNGFFEHKEVVEIHDELLQTLGTAWFDPSTLPEGWQRDPRIVPFRKRLYDVIVRDFSASRLWGVKDPRMCRLVPLWLDILDELGIVAKAILVIRNPSAVAASLHKRDGTDSEIGLMLWLSHVVSAERHSRNVTRIVVNYDDFLADWQLQAQRMRTVLDIDLYSFSQDVIDDVAAFLDADLQHHRDQPSTLSRVPQNAFAATLFEAFAMHADTNEFVIDLCAQAATALENAQSAAIPIANYLRLKARMEFDVTLAAQAAARLGAETQANLMRERLEAQLLSESQRWASETQRLAIESQRHADSIQRANEEATRVARLNAEFIADVERKHRAEITSLREARIRADAQASVEAQLRQQAAAAAVDQFARREQLERELSELQASTSWRLTKPIRTALLALRPQRKALAQRRSISGAATQSRP